MTTPTYSTPDIDKIFNQFLGSVLTNYSKLSTVVAVTNPTVFQNGEVTTATPTPSLDTPTTTRPPSLVVKDDVMTSLSSWSVTLPTSPSIDHNNVMATTTLRTSLPSTSSSPSSSTWSSVQHHTATVNDVDYPDVDFETTANAIINDWSAGGQLSTDPQTVATTLPVAIDVTIDTTENPEVSLQAQEYDNGWTYETHPEDELGTDFYDTENPDEEEEGQSPLPETLQASKTTKSTTTTTPPTTTMRQFNYKKGKQN